MFVDQPGVLKFFKFVNFPHKYLPPRCLGKFFRKELELLKPARYFRVRVALQLRLAEQVKKVHRNTWSPKLAGVVQRIGVGT
jgi:hypothetical protein